MRTPKAASYRLDACRWDFRAWEHDYLYTLFTSNQQTMRGHTGPVYGVAFSPDGKRIVSGGGDLNKPGELKVWDAASGPVNSGCQLRARCARPLRSTQPSEDKGLTPTATCCHRFAVDRKSSCDVCYDVEIARPQP